MGESYEERYRADRRDFASGRSSGDGKRRDDDDLQADRDLQGGTGEVGTDEGYRVANGDEDYRYTPERGWGDQKSAYGNGNGDGDVKRDDATAGAHAARTPSEFPRGGDPRAPEWGNAAVPTSTGGYGGPRARGEFVGRGARGHKRTDAQILADIRDRMSQYPELCADHIEVVVTNGEVVLQGHIADRASKHLADDIADSVGGVTTVHNQLRVAAGDVGTERH